MIKSGECPISSKKVPIISSIIFLSIILFYFFVKQKHGNNIKESSLEQSSVYYSKIKNPSRPTLNCTAGVPCVYEDEVDLRVIVITHDRKASVMKLLESLQVLELDGDKAALEIWIDPKQDGSVHLETYEAVSNFAWLKGPTRVHLQSKHVGIMGQWIDTWRPKNAPPFQKDPRKVDENAFDKTQFKEIGLILEDDLSISSHAYRWLKAAHRKYFERKDYAGSTIQSDEVKAHNNGSPLRGPRNESVFMYSCIGTWGFAPAPKLWAAFQDWFHLIRSSTNASSYHPYVKDAMPTTWYKHFESAGTQDTMWEMWFIHFAHLRGAYTAYNNLDTMNGGDLHSCLSINRREVGLHYRAKGREDFCRLMDGWSTRYIDAMPPNPLKFDWNGNVISR